MGLVGYAQYAPMKFAIRGRFLHLPGLAECLRSEFALYDITIQAYFPATILSPGYDEEQKTKPLVTKKIEEGDDAKTPEQCADCLLKGVAAGSFSITDGIVGTLLRVSSGGSAPGGRLWLDLPLMLPARVRPPTHPAGAPCLASVRRRSHRSALPASVVICTDRSIRSFCLLVHTARPRLCGACSAHPTAQTVFDRTRTYRA